VRVRVPLQQAVGDSSKLVKLPALIPIDTELLEVVLSEPLAMSLPLGDVEVKSEVASPRRGDPFYQKLRAEVWPRSSLA
jgi:hypothetical protein